MLQSKDTMSLVIILDIILDERAKRKAMLAGRESTREISIV